MRRLNSGKAATAGRPIVRTIPRAATPAARPPAPSRLTSWKRRSAARYSLGRTSAVRKKSNSDAWAVTPAPRAYNSPNDRRPASGDASTPMAVVVSAPRTVVPRVMPNAKPDGRKIRIKPTYASGPKRPRRAGPKKNRNLYVKSVRVRDNGLSPPEPASPPGSLDDGHVGLLREPQEDVLEAPFLARVGLGPQRREVAGRDVPSVIHDRDAPAQALRRVELVCRNEHGGSRSGHRHEAFFEEMLSGRVDSDERLVEDQDRRLVDDRRREGDLRLHALRQRGDRFVGLRREIEDLQELGRSSGDPVFREVPNPSDISEEFRRGQVFGQRRCLGHVAQLRLVRDGIHEYVMALDAHDAVVRPQQPDEDLQRRRLVGAVRADEAEDFARVRLEGEGLEGRLAVVRLPELLELDRGSGHANRRRDTSATFEGLDGVPGSGEAAADPEQQRREVGGPHTTFLPRRARRRPAFAVMPSRS